MDLWEYASEAKAQKAETGFKIVDSQLGSKSNREVSCEVVGVKLYGPTRAPIAKTK